MSRFRLLAVCATTSLALLGTQAIAADHLDSPAGTTDPAADLTDLYAWPSADGQQLNLVLNIRAAMFSNVAAYVFNLESTSVFGTAGQPYRIICTFDTAQQVQCWAGLDDYVQGDPRNTDGLVSERGRMRVFAGPRNDPFFFNGAGFETVIAQVRGLGAQADGAGCPQLDMNTAQGLVTQLGSAPGGGQANDAFQANTVSALVVQIDRALVTAGGPLVAVWASVHAQGR